MDPVEFHYAMKDYMKQQEETDRLIGEWIRFHLVHLWNMQGKEIQKGKAADKTWVPLPWDPKVKEPKRQSVDEMRGMFYAIEAAFKDLPDRSVKTKYNLKDEDIKDAE